MFWYLFFVPQTIHIPNLRQDSTRSFGFNVSSLDKDASIQQGSFDCIRQAGNGRRELDNLGALVHKMHIHANEDSYEKTRERMATAEQESKKNCAKVIKITGSDKSAVGRKVKLKRPPGSVPPPASPPFRANASGRDNLTSSSRTSDRLDISSSSRIERPEQRLERLVESMPTLPVTNGPSAHERTSAVLGASANSGASINKNHSPAQANKANRFSNDIMKRSVKGNSLATLVNSYLFNDIYT